MFIYSTHKPKDDALGPPKRVQPVPPRVWVERVHMFRPCLNLSKNIALIPIRQHQPTTTSALTPWIYIWKSVEDVHAQKSWTHRPGHAQIITEQLIIIF